jgi:Skp family chaperone for outer membrane proteins
MEKQAFEKVNADIKSQYQKLQDISKKSKDPKIPPKTRQEYKKQFEREFSILEPQVQKKREQLRIKDALLKRRVHEAVLKAADDLAKKYKLDVLLNANVFDALTVFYASKKIDLTDEAIALLDKHIDEIIKTPDNSFE